MLADLLHSASIQAHTSALNMRMYVIGMNTKAIVIFELNKVTIKRLILRSKKIASQVKCTVTSFLGSLQNAETFMFV